MPIEQTEGVGHFAIRVRDIGRSKKFYDAENEPAAGQIVHTGRLAGELPRPHARQGAEHGPQADSFRLHGRRRQRDPGIRSGSCYKQGRAC